MSTDKRLTIRLQKLAEWALTHFCTCENLHTHKIYASLKLISVGFMNAS